MNSAGRGQNITSQHWVGGCIRFFAAYQATLKSQWLMTKKAPIVLTDGTGSPEAALLQAADRAHLCSVCL